MSFAIHDIYLYIYGRPGLPKEVSKGTLRAIIRHAGLTVSALFLCIYAAANFLSF